ncbi:hypothetical protein FQ186_27370 [Pseudomonas sp. ANT_H14]|nr:hypothetical protein FQ186_27370 [Pseudomonas sp. ANT_H14]
MIDLETWMIDSTAVRATRASSGAGKKGDLKNRKTTRADSTRIWTPIPRTLGQRFHADLDTHSTATWTLIPRALGQ